VFRHGWRGMKSDLASNQLDFLVVVEFEIHNTIAAERRNRRARPRIQSDESVAGCDVENAFVAVVVGPIRQTASGKQPGSICSARAFAFAMHPDHLAGGSVERYHGAAASC